MPVVATSPALTFDESAHRYTLDGVVVRSVTGILGQSGVVDFSGVPEAILRAAMERGTNVHLAVHYYNEDDLDLEAFAEAFPGCIGYVRSWIELLKSGRLKTVLCEHRVASRVHQYAGTIDWLGEFDGQAAIIDFATGDPKDCAKDLQTMGYVIAATEWSREPGQTILRDFIDRHRYVARYSVRLNKAGSLPAVTRYTDPRDLSDFLALLAAARIVTARKPKTTQWEDYAE
jgi:hypothetical protein